MVLSGLVIDYPFLGTWFLDRMAQSTNPASSQRNHPYAFSGNITIGFGQQKTGLLESTAVTLGRVGTGMLIGLLVSSCLAVIVVELPVLRRLILPVVSHLPRLRR